MTTPKQARDTAFGLENGVTFALISAPDALRSLAQQVEALTAARNKYLAASTNGRPVEHEYSSYVAFARALEVYCTTLENERDALKVDADRYQWLRTQNAHLESSLTISLVDQTAEQLSDSIWVGSDLGAVVDNAMKAAS